MKIAFYGATGSSDFGDYAMVVHNIQCIANACNDTEFYIITPDKNITLKYLYENILDGNLLKRIELVSEPIIYNPVSLLIDKYCGKYLNRFYYSDKVFNEVLNQNYNHINNDFLNYIKKADILVYNGGGYLQHSWKEKNIVFSIAYVIAAQMNKKVYFLGNSIGPLLSWDKYIKQTIHYISKILVRDGRNYTAKLLDRYGFKNYVCGPDDIMFACEKYKNRDKLFIEKLKNKKSNGYIIIEVMVWIEKSNKGAEYIISCLSEFINYVIETKNKNVLLVVFDNDDMKAKTFIDKIYERSVHKERVFLYKKINNIYEIFGFYRYCDYSLSFKYHPLVLALGNKKSCTAIICDNEGYYESKLKGAFDTCEVEQSVLHINEVTTDKLIQSFEKKQTIMKAEKENELKSIRTAYIEDIISENNIQTRL